MENNAIISDVEEGMTILDALDRIQEEVRDSKLSDEFWAECKESIDFVCEKLHINRMQAVLIAIFCEVGEPMSWRQIGKYIGISRLKTMSLTSDVEDLRNKRWIYQCGAMDHGTMFQGFKLVYGVVTAFRYNKEFVPEQIEGLSLQAFVDRLVRYLRKEGRDHNVSLEENTRWVIQLAAANQHLPLCRTAMSLYGASSKMFFLVEVADYAQTVGNDDEGLTLDEIESWLEEGCELDMMLDDLREGNHELLMRGLLDYGCQDGLVDTGRFRLSQKAKDTLLAEYKPRPRRERGLKMAPQDLLKPKDIKEKTLYFNEEERRQIDRLKSLLSRKGLDEVQTRLSECGLRRGITCLFYGGPGTGKTESVLQLARETGREVMQVDIAGLRDKWVGESEKNIKGVFDRYRSLCKSSGRTPILFFNEADAVINRRVESVSSSVDKMDNSMQNIILQELENFDGILIATTNLTGNLDRAFDRRFLFKVEFSMPDIGARKDIWHSMLPEAGECDCLELAREFDFSGGQIENVARKCRIEYVLSGETPALGQIREFCKEERLNRDYHKKIGF